MLQSAQQNMYRPSNTNNYHNISVEDQQHNHIITGQQTISMTSGPPLQTRGLKMSTEPTIHGAASPDRF
jgi:hypothetical protein